MNYPFASSDIFMARVNGIQMQYIKTGAGEPLVLLHGWPQHSYLWHKVIPRLSKHFTIIAPDLRGTGGSSITKDGYDKKTMAQDVYELLGQLGFDQVNVAGYDLGVGVAYSLAAGYKGLVKRLAVMEYDLPGFGFEQGMNAFPGWSMGNNWHVGLFTLPNVAVQLFMGKERELLSWFFWHSSYNQYAISQEDIEVYYRQLLKPGALRAGIEYYAAVWTDAENNKAYARTKLTMPVLAIGAENSAGEYTKLSMQQVAERVEGEVATRAGHWIVEERPDYIISKFAQFFRTEIVVPEPA